MRGIVDLANSERGVFCITLVLVSGGLVALGQISSSMWIDYTKWIATVLVASKTLTGAIETLKSAPSVPTAQAIDKKP